MRQLKSQKDLKAQHSMCMDTLEQQQTQEQQQQQQQIITLSLQHQSANQILNNNLSELNLQQQQQQQLTATTPKSGAQQQQQQQQHANPVTPSLRVAALNLVGDALRKVTVSTTRCCCSRTSHFLCFRSTSLVVDDC